MTDIVERLRDDEIERIRIERDFCADEVKRLRVALLQANDGSELLVAKSEIERLRERAAMAEALVISHEGHIEKLRATILDQLQNMGQQCDEIERLRKEIELFKGPPHTPERYDEIKRLRAKLEAAEEMLRESDALSAKSQAENERLDADCESLAENNDKLNAENAKLREALTNLIVAMDENPTSIEALEALNFARAALQKDEGE